MEIGLGLIILLPLAGSLIAAFLPSHARTAASWLAALVGLASLLLAASFLPAVAGGDVVRVVLPWLPQFGLEFNLRMDGYAWLFTMLVALMGVLVVLYARYYMSDADPVPRFFSFLLAFMGAMLGIVLSGNLIQLVVFWELTSLMSFMLIAYWYHRQDARRGAQMALIVTIGGGLSLLLGVLVLGAIVGSYDLDVVLASGSAIRAHPWYATALVLIVIGALTKSAQFPFHFWLPHAMAAPTPVSAYLHSAAMVKAGVFLLARLWPALSGTELWFVLIAGAGAASLLLGAISATFQKDMKGVLAYSTVSHLGLITLLLGINSRLGLVAALFHMINHATFKASLFMAAGIVDHETGTRDLRRLSGLRRQMPVTAIVTTVAAGAMAGVPLLNGFLSKEMFFAESIAARGQGGLYFALPAVATLAGVFSVAYSLRFIHQVFFGPLSQDLPRTPGEPTRGMLLPSALLVIACLLVGMLPTQTIGPMLAIAAHSILGAELPPYRLAVWHGLTAPLVMSFIALAGGAALYAVLYRRHRAMASTPILSRLNARRIFDALNASAIRGAGRLTRILFSWRTQPQLMLIVCAALVAGSFPLAVAGWTRGSVALSPVDPVFAALWVVGAVCAIGTAALAKFHRLAALIMAGGTGLVVCLTFAWFSAPDLALTQISVEIVTLVLILLGLRWLPQRLDLASARRRALRIRVRRGRDLAVAALAGTGIAALTLAALTRPSNSGLAEFFLGASLEQAGGRNVVNVMLVDFRGFDTMGEITVVGTVAIIVYALLRRFRPAPESIAAPHAQSRSGAEQLALASLQDQLPRGDLKIPAVLVRLLLPIAGLVAMYFVLRGHDAPGGGFVGGLIMATAMIAQYMVGGTMWVESRLRVNPLVWIGVGLLAAVAAGVVAWGAHQPFLTAQSADLLLPVLGNVRLSTTLIFDLGVFMVVVGATLLMLIALAHQSLRAPRKTVTPVSPEADEDTRTFRPESG